MTNTDLMSTTSISTPVTTREQEIEQIQSQLKQALKIKDPEKRTSELKVLGARLEDVQAKDQEDQMSMAARVRELEKAFDGIDVELGDLEKLNPEEQQIITDAEKAVAEAEDAIVEAGKAWVFKDSKVDAAKVAKTSAETALVAAKQRADEMKSMRLQKATIRESMAWVMKATEAVKQEAITRRTAAETQSGILKTQLGAIEKELSAAAGNADTERKKVETITAKVTDARSALAEMQKGTQGYVEAEAKVRELESSLETATAERDKALGSSNELKNFLSGTSVAFKTQQKLKRNLDIILDILETGLSKRPALIEARLETNKGLEALRVSRQVADVGAEVDKNNLESQAQAANVADEFVTDFLEKQPGRIQEGRQILADQEENARAIKNRVQKLWEQYDTDYDKKAA